MGVPRNLWWAQRGPESAVGTSQVARAVSRRLWNQFASGDQSLEDAWVPKP